MSMSLETLPVEQYRAGLGEVVKYGVILDSEFFEYLESHIEQINEMHKPTLTKIIKRSCELKAEVVLKDERETTGLRAKLNYGHTFAHAFEKITGYGSILHGEAVSMGMICASDLAQRMQMIDESVTTRQLSLLKALSMKIDPPNINVKDFTDAVLRDKKSVNGEANFILPDRIGNVEIVSNIDPAFAFESVKPQR